MDTSDGKELIYVTRLRHNGNGRKEKDLVRQKAPVFSVVASGEHYVAAGQGLLQTWDRSSLTPLPPFNERNAQFTAIAAIEDLIVVGTQRGEVLVFQGPKLTEPNRFPAFPASPDKTTSPSP